ncbi:MAG: carboxypeptidase regulatory-like domain-containing protein [Geobacter sp.]|nr:carboxypeptidase regulatory-like domain-containing protein [Geobacter sp.]
MAQWEITRHQVAIAGKVTETATGKPIPGARVVISSATVACEVITELDGHFHVLDLADGEYDLEASVSVRGSRYGTATTQATVARNGVGRVLMAVADMQLAVIH